VTTASTPVEPEERILTEGKPHLSFSRIGKYLDCPEKYRLYYIEHLRARCPSASMVFGSVVHAALSHLFKTGQDPVQRFTREWDEVKKLDLTYGQRDSWEKLRETGRHLLERFVSDELPRIGGVQASEKAFELEITSLDLPFVGVIDLLAEVDGKQTVIDFKTAAKSYEEHEVVLSDQLSGYWLAEPEVKQVAFCVLVKTKEPKVQWHFSTRTGAKLTRCVKG